MTFSRFFLGLTATVLMVPSVTQADIFKSSSTTVTDWAGITATRVARIVQPRTVAQLQAIVRDALAKKQKVSIKGAGFSQGGQTAIANGVVVDMKYLNKIISLDTANQKLTVQPGAIWNDILAYIDPYNLSIQVMQSYGNFSVGGSLSVNVHGRHNQCGQLIETVESIKVVLADGSLVTASREQNYDLFRSAIGGYGYMGIIVEATLRLAQNEKLMRQVKLMDISEYAQFFQDNIHNNPLVVVHNGNLYPNDFNKVLSIAWCKTDAPLTVKDRVQEQAKIYPKELIGLQVLRRVSKAKEWRAQLEPKVLQSPEVTMRNFIIAENTKALEPLIAFPTTHILQEYFVPCHQLEHFVDVLRSVANFYNVNILNCSIRYVPASTESYLSYAPQDSFALVLYINILNTASGKQATSSWTQKLIDGALACGGSFYLPYQLSARKDQLLKAYPQFETFVQMKKSYDPLGLFCNELFRKYA